MKKTTKKILYGVIALAGLATAGVKVASAIQRKQCAGDEKNPFEGKKVIFVKNEEDAENADGVKGASLTLYYLLVELWHYLRYCWELLWQSRLMIRGLYFLRRSGWGRIRNTSACISSAA